MLSATLKQLIDTVPLPLIDGHAPFVAWLKFAHGIMQSSVPLMEFAATKAGGELRDYLREHAAEERQHATWMAEDIAKLGETLPRFDHAVAATAGAQYYYLQHVGPHALLGYMAAMEFRPMPMAHVEALARIYGEDVIRTLRLHAVSDVEHGKALARVIDQHEAHADIICYSAFCTAKMLQFYLNERIKVPHGPVH
jgi:hypothetical protein